MVQAWYQGGLSVFDFTDAAHPVEIAYFDRGPIDADEAGHRRVLVDLLVQRLIYGSEIVRGLDIFKLVPSDVPVAERNRRGALVQLDEFNVQQQSRMTWPPTFVVARAYLDQLTRCKGILPVRARPLRRQWRRRRRAARRSRPRSTNSTR